MRLYTHCGGKALEFIWSLEVSRQVTLVTTRNVMVALPNIGGALCSTPQSLADAHYLTAVQ